MKEAFLKYTAAGFKCLPTLKDKSPAIKVTWLGGVSDPEKYTSAAGIGILCGKDSGNLECMDFDNHFGDAKDVLSAFLSDEVKLIYTKYALPIEKTVSGGFHLLYRCSTIAGNQKLAQRPKKDGERWVPDTLVETRGQGGYFCVDPTPGYKLIRNPENIFNVPEISPEEREVLITTAKTFNTWHEVKKQEYEAGDRPGDLFNNDPDAIDQVKNTLVSAGWEELRSGTWRRPGKKNGISATLGKAAANIFYCFSSNAHPFTNNAGYSPFQVIGLLKYNGDFKAFAKDLAERYQLTNVTNVNTHTRKEPQPQKTKKEFDDILKNSFIDLEIPVEKPPVIMWIKDREATEIVKKRLFTLGNFSCTTGKSKSKKTFLSTLFLAAASSNTEIQGKILADLPEGKQAVFLFDTEQSRYDSYVTALRIPRLLSGIPKNFGAFDLREYSPIQRCEIIEFALNKFKDNLGFVVIDGIADLANAINDEEEATRVVSLLMKWTKIYNCHIHTIIHENKADTNATGHLGSSILKKAETIISVTKDSGNYRRSTVKCTLIRGTADFNNFDFIINGEGLPEVESAESVSTYIDRYTEPVKEEF